MISFVVEEAGCESCAALVREALGPLGGVGAIDVDEAANTADVRLSATDVTEDEVNGVLAEASEGVGHAYRVRPGSWHAH